MLKTAAILGAGMALGVVLGGAGVLAWNYRVASAPAFATVYQVVLLDSGQVYYGKLEGLGTRFPVLHDVYYVQTTTDPQTKQVTNVLVRRGKELHAPASMVVNTRHIVMIEPVDPSSKIAQLIAEQEQQK